MKEHKSEMNILRDITADNIEHQLIKDQATLSTKIFSEVVSLEESQDHS